MTTPSLTNLIDDLTAARNERAAAARQSFVAMVDTATGGLPGITETITHGLRALSEWAAAEAVETALTLARSGWTPQQIHDHLRSAYTGDPLAIDMTDLPEVAQEVIRAAHRQQIIDLKILDAHSA